MVGSKIDREKIRQHRTVHALGEGLSFGFVLLAVAFHAVSEDLVKEHAGGAAGENGGPDERIHHRRLEQPRQILGDSLDGGQDHFIFGQIPRIHGFKGFRRSQVHSIVGARDGRNDDARKAAAVLQAVAFGGGQVLGFRLRHHTDAAGQNARILGEGG